MNTRECANRKSNAAAHISSRFAGAGLIHYHASRTWRACEAPKKGVILCCRSTPGFGPGVVGFPHIKTNAYTMCGLQRSFGCRLLIELARVAFHCCVELAQLVFGELREPVRLQHTPSRVNLCNLCGCVTHHSCQLLPSGIRNVASGTCLQLFEMISPAWRGPCRLQWDWQRQHFAVFDIVCPAAQESRPRPLEQFLALTMRDLAAQIGPVSRGCLSLLLSGKAAPQQQGFDHSKFLLFSSDL